MSDEPAPVERAADAAPNSGQSADFPRSALEDLPEEPSYETGVARVEAIIRCLDAGEASLGETLELVREGKELIERCALELEAVGGALEELRLEDLVARLESEEGR